MREGIVEVEWPTGAWNTIHKALTIDDISTSYSHQITNLYSGSSYQLEVVAYNDVGSSPPNDLFIFTTPVDFGK